MINQAVKWGTKNPRKLFIVDGAGALLSAFFLGIVLVRLESIFGIPPSTLYFLASFPILFAVYDLICYFRAKKLNIFLKGIAIANLVYCILSLGLAFYHQGVITLWGWGYFLVEVLVIVILSRVELKVSNRIR